MTRPVRQLALTTVVALAAFVVPTETVAAATAPPAFGYGTPGFAVSAAPSSFSGATVAGEPSIGVDWRTGAAMYMAGTSTARLTFDNASSTPVTWTDVSSPYSDVNLDPILATDHQTGTTLAGGDNGPCAVMSVTTNDGGFLDPTSWTPSTPCPFTADHPTVGMGPYAGAKPVNALSPFVTYFCQQTDVDECSHSYDGGLTWSPSVPDTNFTCLSLFGHVKVSADGTAYIPSANCFDANNNPDVGAIVTTDNGQTLTGLAIPGAPTPADGFDPSIATDASNRVYETWSRAGDYHPVITWSDDHGAHWAPQVELGTDLSTPLKAATFESAVAGDAGRAAVAFLGTSDGQGGTDPFTTGYSGTWYLYVSSTYDGGATWHTALADPQPVQRGEIDAGGTTTSGQRNLLDFMDASLTKDGRVVVAYADGCIGACNAGGTAADSTASYATVAYQTTGEGLFSAYDVVPVTAPSAPSLSAAAAPGAVDLSWTVPADGGSAITGYQVLRGTSTGGETLLTTLPAGTTAYNDTATTAGTTYYYVVQAVNSVGVGDPSNEASATPASAPAAPTATAADGNGKVALSWAAPADGGSAITGYQVSRGLAPGTETPYATVGTVTSYADTAVTPGTTYYYTVTATNAVGASPPSRETSAVPTTVPSAPTLTASGGKAQVSLSWSTPANGGAPITGWAIYRATSSGAETLIQTVSSGNSYVDATVTGGTTYYYEVAATNRNGTGALSPEATATAKKGK